MKYLEKEHNWNIYVKGIGMDAYLLASSCGQLEVMKYLEKEHKSSNGQLEVMKYLEKEHNWDITF